MFAFNSFNINEVTNSFQNIDNIIYKCYDSLILLKDFIKKISKYICILLIFYIILYAIFYQKKLDIEKLLTKKTFEDECKDIKNFMNLSINNILLDKYIDLNNYITDNPKISVVIPVYNGEKYIKSALTSIQNQDLKDIEIIMIDDFSDDNSVKLIHELMKKEPRIKLYENKENKGILYTKCFGVYVSKGKYIMLLDEDDIFGQREAFSTLYKLAEKDDLDILGFSTMFTEQENILGKYIHHYYESPIIYQPNITKLSHDYTYEGKVKRVGDNIWCYLFKTETLNNSIMQINSNFLKTKMICHEDYLILFLITRNAKKSRQIKRIFHIKITYGKPKLYITKAKSDNKMNLFCQSYLNYIEFILMKTNNTIRDKKISSYELDRYFLSRKECQNNTYVRKRVIKVCRSFLKNKYIEKYIKEKILQVFNEQNIKLSKHFLNKINNNYN